MKKRNYILFLATLCLAIFLSACTPQVIILTPQDGDNFAVGEEITFSGEATVPGKGDLPDSALVWSVDGVEIGTGALIKKSDIAEGTHSVKLTATSADVTGSDEITITVGDGGNTTTTTTQIVDDICAVCPLDPPVINCDLSCMNNFNSTKQCPVCYTMDMSTGFTKIGYKDGSYQISEMDVSTGEYTTKIYDKYGNLCSITVMDLGNTSKTTTSDSSGKECYSCETQSSENETDLICIYGNGKTYIEHIKQVGDETEISWTCPSGVTLDLDPSCYEGTGTNCPPVTGLPACQ